MTPSDESGDAHRFTQQLAQRCAEADVKFSYERRIVSLLPFVGDGDTELDLVAIEIFVDRIARLGV